VKETTTTMEVWTKREIIHIAKHAKNYGHQRRSSRLCPKNNKSKYYEGKTLKSTEWYHDKKIITFVIPIGEPADQYSPVLNILRKGNPVCLDTNAETGVGECAPCAGSNLTLNEKIMSLDKMELVEENEDDLPSADDQESVV
jgi:hypothetical protein